MDIEKSLRKLVLTKYKAVVHLKISKRGIAKANKIYKEVKIPISKINETLSSLASKGLIEINRFRVNTTTKFNKS